MWARFRAWQRRNPRRSRRIAITIAAWGLVCLVGDLLAERRPAELPTPDPSRAEAAVLCGGMNGALDYVAVHTWIVVHAPGESEWERWEITGGAWHVEDDDLVRRNAWWPPTKWPFGEGPTQVLKTWSGDDAERLIAAVRARDYPYSTSYYAWPGPNSNTYVDTMLRRARIGYELPSTAIGRDYRGWVGASQSTTLSGFQLESPLVGVQFGLTEGLEVHVAAATFGVDPWPPALKVPYGDGRFGWDE